MPTGVFHTFNEQLHDAHNTRVYQKVMRINLLDLNFFTQSIYL